jgi:L-arabinose isomerase
VMTTNVPVDTWAMFTEMARTELLVIDEHATKRGFADQLRANQAYYRLARGL